MDFGTKFGLASAIAAMGVAIIALFVPYEWRDFPTWLRRAFLLLGGLLLVGAIPLFFGLPSVEFPLVSLRFINKQITDFQIYNSSNIGARNIKWMLVMWDINTPARIDPLPIPATLFDFLGPHGRNLPVGVFQTPLVKPLIKEGDRLFGSASVMCPDCSRGFTFWVYIEWGHGGWYAEVSDMKTGEVIYPKKATDMDAFMKSVADQIPTDRRIPIDDME
jgi:hypothetical protein